MKVLGAVIIHYGKDYFKQSLASIVDHVDEIVVFYTNTPSHGTLTRLQCPDTRDELRAIADQFKCTWVEVSHIGQENQHRQQYINYAVKNGFDQILIVDSDEIHVSEKIPEMLEAANNEPFKRVGVRGSQWLTLYRSFNDYVTDGFAPIRVINVNKPDGESFIDKGFIYHMGYCITDQLMEYKISCHGHRADFQKNNSWLTNKWHNFKSGVTQYLHPATEAYWIDAHPFDKNTLPQLLIDHPYFNLDIIK